jgi:hypothetical protein
VVGVGGAPEGAPELGATAASHTAPTFRAMIEECKLGANPQYARQPSPAAGVD